MSQAYIIDVSYRTIRSLAGYPELRILDLSCGLGELLLRFHRDGCTCTGTRYRVDDYVVRGKDIDLPADVQIVEDIDLDATLPFPDGSFDVVVMTEVLEHLANHLTVIREAGRVLRPGGHLFFTTPNIQRLHSRFHFFMSGTHKLLRRRTGWDLAPDDLYAFHINPVGFPLVHTLLHQAGLHVHSLALTRVRLRHAYWFLLYPAFAVAAFLTFGGSAREPAAYRTGERDLRRWMLHPKMLASEQLAVLARRDN